MFFQWEIYFCFIKRTKVLTIAVSNKLGLKSGRLNSLDGSESYFYHWSVDQMTLKGLFDKRVFGFRLNI